MDNKEKVRRKSWDIKFDPPKARPFSLGPEEDSIMAEILAASILSRSIIQETNMHPVINIFKRVLPRSYG